MAQSVFLACDGLGDAGIDLLILDDGVPATIQLEEISKEAAARGIGWRYHNKRSRPGLLRSRIEAVALAARDWVLFLDDDVELEPDYIRRFLDIVRQTPALAGLGGVDLLAAERGFPAFLVCLAAGLEPLRVGKLSFGGFPAQMSRARKAHKPYESRRLYGCNMGFRRNALHDLRMLPAFEGYSLFEDAYLSHAASTAGPMVIDPSLKVKHRCSPISRDGSFAVGRMSIRNHVEIMRIRSLGRGRLAAASVSLLMFVLLSTIRAALHGGRDGRHGWSFVRGQLVGLKDLAAGMSALQPSRSRNISTE
jgi:hypothetical protein